jgi:hypothetical protein
VADKAPAVSAIKQVRKNLRFIGVHMDQVQNQPVNKGLKPLYCA